MSRLLHLVALLALSLAPVAMHGAPAAAAAPHHEMVDAHCGGGEESPDDENRGRVADCAIACSAIACGSALLDPPAVPPAVYGRALTPFYAGGTPGSDPPPPRLA